MCFCACASAHVCKCLCDCVRVSMWMGGLGLLVFSLSFLPCQALIDTLLYEKCK